MDMQRLPKVFLIIFEFILTLCKIVSILIAVFFVLINTIWGVEQKNVIYPLIDTQFTGQFSFENWNKIKPKQSKKEVLEIIGKPFSITERFKDSLSNPHQAAFSMLYSIDGAWKYSDFAWCAYEVFLDKDMNVINKAETWWED
jgi:hypothetical protein